jgi:DNA polymerase-3 subunit gamma/tau
MEQFVVSARKYRPVTFDSVVGQAHITTTLKNAIRTNHLAQAFLFCGPRGVGKTTCARIMAKTINCQNLADNVEACGECESCRSFQNNASFNITELDAASNNSVDDIRNLIEQVRYAPQSGKYKIYIIDEVHMLSSAAFNAFLKTLEEPPSYAIFILATTEKHKILPTILSRCQIFDFNRIVPTDISNHLATIAEKENIGFEKEALEIIAQKADGGLRDALSMFDLNVTFSTDQFLRYSDVLNNLHILDYDYYFKITQALIEGQVGSTLLLFDEIIRKGFDSHLFLVGLLDHFRNLLVCKDTQTIQLLEVSESTKAKYHQQATLAPMSFLLSALSIGNQCDIHYKSSKNQRLHIEICLIKMAKIQEVLRINDTPPVEETAKKKTSIVTDTPAPTYTSTSSSASQPTPVQEKVAPAQPVAPVTGNSRLRSTVNLNRGAVATPTTVSSVPTSENTLPITEKTLALTQENLTFEWNKFKEARIRQFNKSSEEVTLSRDVRLQNNVILLNLDNDLQRQTLEEIKVDLLTYLRRVFATPNLQLEAQVFQDETQRRPYTPIEKFKSMSEKNPALTTLQNLLGLDVDF